MLIIGVTGCIGSGKSTVSKILSSYGAEIIDADKLAKEIMEKGGKAYDDVISAFGNEILDKYGTINRKKLASIVFNNIEKLNLLNKITHKHVTEEILKKLDELQQIGKTGICVLDVPIPVEHGFIDTADEIWVVTSSVEKRIERIMIRNNMTREEAEERINAQIRQEEYIKLADHILENDGTLSDLEEKVSEYLKRKNYW